MVNVGLEGKPGVMVAGFGDFGIPLAGGRGRKGRHRKKWGGGAIRRGQRLRPVGGGVRRH